LHTSWLSLFAELRYATGEGVCASLLIEEMACMLNLGERIVRGSLR